MIPLEIYILFCLLALIVLASVVFCGETVEVNIKEDGGPAFPTRVVSS